ncbi:MAG: VCBS repeat-containing protein [Nitrospirae bacterium]|nr:VCBS repeat-containing protein [Nitrospirota bacterium]
MTSNPSKKVIVRAVILMLFLFISTFSISHADDLDPHYKFSGVKSPDSPYKNTWGAFQTNLFSGSFTYDYKIAVPPGTNGLAPEITLSYNSHSAKGKAGWVGSGWEIPLSYIQRDIEYTRKDTSDDTFDLFLDGAKHDLVYVASENLFHTKVEAYLRVEKKTGAPNETGEYWITQTKDGTEYRFGYNTDSENRVRSSDASVPAYVWRWSLDRIKDSNGNCIYFTYIENQGSVYLDTITYNNDGKRIIQFIREAKPDAYLMIEQGSEVYDAYRLSEIQIKVNGSLARKYKLAYKLNETQNKSLLSSITQYGADGVTALPPVKFEYKVADKGFNEGVNWATPGERRIRKTDGDNDTVIDTFDVNGDGLPDFVEYDGNNYLWNIWFNNKNGFNASNVAWSVPSSPDGGWDIRDVEQYIVGQQSPDTRSAPMDLNNDGYVDFLWSDHTNVMRFKINNGTGFSPTTHSWTLPVAKACVREVIRPDGTNPNVMQDYSDINGDGLPDLVKKENDTSWHIWRNTGSSFVDYGIWPVPHIDAWLEDYTTGDPTELQTGRYDVNGDGLIDIVDAHSTPWKVYLNTGSNFLPSQQWAAAFSYINDTNSSGDVKRDLIDMNGDGLPDIVNPVFGVQSWEVYFNTGKGFTSKMSWPVPAEVPQNGYVNNIEDSQVGREVLDINGDGLADLVRHIDSVSYWRVYSNK